MAALVTGCAQSASTQLPDLATKTAAPNGHKPLSSADQKKAIDELIAKRDAKAAN